MKWRARSGELCLYSQLLERQKLGLLFLISNPSTWGDEGEGENETKTNLYIYTHTFMKQKVVL
jgi:hypothetical protein